MQEMAALTKWATRSAAKHITVSSDHHINTSYIKCKPLFISGFLQHEKVTHGIEC